MSVQKLKIIIVSSFNHAETTIMILNFRTDTSGQNSADPDQTAPQSDQGLHCLLFHLHVFDKIPSGLASLFEF